MYEEYWELEEKAAVNPGKADKYLKKAAKELEVFCRDFHEQHGVELVFTEEALGRLAEESASQGRSLLQLCRQRFRDVQFGLKLIQKNTGRKV